MDCVDLLEERIKGLLGATVSVGETNTLPAGSEATASASKRGYDTVLDFGIPKGEPGHTPTDTELASLITPIVQEQLGVVENGYY